MSEGGNWLPRIGERVLWRGEAYRVTKLRSGLANSVFANLDPGTHTVNVTELRTVPEPPCLRHDDMGYERTMEPPTDEDFEPPEPEAEMNGLEGVKCAVRVAREIGCGLSLTPDQVAALYCQLDVPPPAEPESKPAVPRVVILPDGLVYELGRCVGVHEPTVLGGDL